MKKGYIVFILEIILIVSIVSSFEVRYFPTDFDESLSKLKDYCSNKECVSNRIEKQIAGGTVEENIFYLRSFYNKDVSLKFIFYRYSEDDASINDNVIFKVIIPYTVENRNKLLNCTLKYNQDTGEYYYIGKISSSECIPKYIINESEYNWKESLRKDLYKLKEKDIIDTEDELIEDMIILPTKEEYLYFRHLSILLLED